MMLSYIIPQVPVLAIGIRADRGWSKQCDEIFWITKRIFIVVDRHLETRQRRKRTVSPLG